jgi:hypothetical protein
VFARFLPAMRPGELSMKHSLRRLKLGFRVGKSAGTARGDPEHNDHNHHDRGSHNTWLFGVSDVANALPYAQCWMPTRRDPVPG